MDRSSLHSTGMSRGTVKSYATGFVLALVLTAAAFAVVMLGGLSHGATAVAVSVAAVAQILVHLHYFLHMDASSRARWNVLALILAGIIMVLAVGGTVWIMAHLHYRLAR